MEAEIDTLKNELEQHLELLIENNEFLKAEKLIDEFELLFPNDSLVYCARGIICFNKKEYNSAQFHFETGLNIDSNNIDLLYNLAYLNENVENYISAYRIYKKAKKINTGKKFEFLLAEKVNTLEKYQSVIEYINRKKVLFIDYIFPPLAGSGVQRALKFIKYCRDFNYEPIVVTTSNHVYYPTDATLLKEIPNEVEVIYIDESNVLTSEKLNELFDMYAKVLKNDLEILKELLNSLSNSKEDITNYLIPDIHILFANEIIRILPEILDIKDIDLIYSTSGPYSSHIAALLLKQRFKLPWVADFRDEWTNNAYLENTDKSDLLFSTLEKMEKSILENADHIITTTVEAKDNYIVDFSVNPSRITTIFNGYDESDFISSDTKNATNTKFRMIHNGSFYMNRTPLSIFKAINLLVKNQKINIKEIEMIFTSENHNLENWQQLVERMGLSEIIQYTGYLSHPDSIEISSNANLLLLIVGDTPKCKNVIPGKLFEYLKLDAPIVAISPSNSAVENVLNNTNRGLNFECGDELILADFIYENYLAWKTGKVVSNQGIQDEIEKFTRKNLTRQLCEIFNYVTEQRNNITSEEYTIPVNKEEDKNFYDSLFSDGGWDQTYFKHYSDTHYFPIWEKAFSLIKGKGKDLKILEIGCGPGQFAQLLFERKVTDYQGFDFSDKAIEMAKQTNKMHHEKFHVGDAFETKVFDHYMYNLVIIFEVLEHIEDDIAILDKIKEDTTILFSVPNFDSPGHVRWFNSIFDIYERYRLILDIKSISIHKLAGENKIYLVKANKK
ncbi:methyltransferase domain-containing protein [Exiguobacterium sp. s146]|uniref:methyltransferase domain-containing protein n=1 Tax=Exiguobacterium sp. s146 TaxID=2751223 RepID=UPI001BE70090|nr:methyltransferase domain-containing protein [Exiguobacterium sp. s146]